MWTFARSGTVIQFPSNCSNKDELGLPSAGLSDQFGISHGRRSQLLNKTTALTPNNTQRGQIKQKTDMPYTGDTGEYVLSTSCLKVMPL